MPNGLETEGTDVEERILGEFMTQLQESDVDFEIVEEMEGVLNEDDFGGEELIVERIEGTVLDDAD